MRPFRVALRVAVLLCLGAAAVSLLALSGEYPGASAANRRVMGGEPLALALLAWAHLAVLEAGRGRALNMWVASALAGDLVLLVRSAAAAQRGAPPLTLALPGIGALLLVGAVGVAWQSRRAGARSPSAR
jgi:hypothetical protein